MLYLLVSTYFQNKNIYVFLNKLFDKERFPSCLYLEKYVDNTQLDSNLRRSLSPIEL